MRSSLGMGWLDNTSCVDPLAALSSWQVHEEAIDQVKNVLTLGLDGICSVKSLQIGPITLLWHSVCVLVCHLSTT